MIHKNILVIISSAPLLIGDIDEYKLLTHLFKSSHKPDIMSQRVLFAYDIDTTLLTKSDGIFQRFREMVADGDYDRRESIRKMTFTKAYYELRAQ